MNLTLNLALWIVAGLLAVVFLLSSAKLFVPKEKTAGMGSPRDGSKTSAPVPSRPSGPSISWLRWG
ncbi:MAG TPA: hypothetical protein VGQ22_20080 [Steroidobacteraceae bacterium]|jgi:hypothetical protein|nr:hypothetical protein [Steroidobacteraceae bacterium]